MRATGRAQVRLTVPEVERLLDPAQASAVGQELLDHVPTLEPVLASFVEPEVAVRCVVARRDVVAEHRVHATPEVAAVLVSGRVEGAEEVELTGLHPTAVPALLASLVDLGPHRREHDGALADPDVVRDLLAPDDLLRASALQLVGADSAWSVEVLAPGREPRVLSGIDGTAGLALLADGEDGRARWVPSTSTDVFLLFSTLYA